jgi:hypothetical protein
VSSKWAALHSRDKQDHDGNRESNDKHNRIDNDEHACTHTLLAPEVASSNLESLDSVP